MIKISMDESSAFDVLSIYQIKTLLSDTQDKKNTNVKNCLFLITEIEEQIGKDLCNFIMGSEEYDKLKEANLKTFQAVDKAKTDEVSASVVDKANHERYKWKRKLQQKFFQNDVTETKVGYEKLQY